MRILSSIIWGIAGLLAGGGGAAMLSGISFMLTGRSVNAPNFRCSKRHKSAVAELNVQPTNQSRAARYRAARSL